MTRATPEDIETLAGESRWVEALARSLVGDFHLAEDVVQETWLRAMQRGPREGSSSLAAWIRGIARNVAAGLRRSDGRRIRRERDVAGSAREEEAEPSSHDIAARVEQQRLLVEAVLGLDEPYRRTVLLRFFEGLPQREIARREGIPTTTVNSRLTRAIGELRRRLDHLHGGDRSSWLVGLAPLFSNPGARSMSGASGVIGVKGALIMTSKMKVAAGAMIVSAALLMVPIVFGGFDVREPEEATGSTPEAAALTAGAEAGAAAETGDPGDGVAGDVDRMLVPAAGKEATHRAPGSLLVRVEWSDGQSAPGVPISLGWSAPGLPPEHYRRAVSDAAGVLQFGDLVPFMTYSLRSARGGDHKVGVGSGKPTEFRFVIPEGVDVEGVVVDRSGVVVPGASIWLTTGATDWLGGDVVAHSDAGGRFVLRSVPGDQSLGAFADGRGPSALVDLDEVDVTVQPVPVELLLTAEGGTVAGVVRNAAGDPVQGADVCVGRAPREMIWRSVPWTGESWTPRCATTDAAGRYRLVGLEVGAHPVVARGPDLGGWNGACRVEAGVTAPLDITLPEGVTVYGVVRDAAGRPTSHAFVRAFDSAPEEPLAQWGRYLHHGAFSPPFVKADAAGCYRLTGLTAGAIHLHAAPGGKKYGEQRGDVHEPRLVVRRVLRAEPGAELRWDPKLERGHAIEGVVTYRDGRPMQYAFVVAHDDNVGKYQEGRADADGRFHFINLQAIEYRIGVVCDDAPEGTVPLETRGIRPDRGIVRLVADYDAPVVVMRQPGSVTLRVEDAAGRSPGAVLSVVLASNSGQRARTGDEDGTFHFFHFAGMPAKRYQAVVLSRNQVIHAGPWFDLGEGEDLDLGTFVTRPGGSLAIHLRREPGTERSAVTIQASTPDRALPSRIDIGRALYHVEPNLCPGRYDLSVAGEGVVPVRTGVTVEAGRRAALEIRLRRAVQCRLVMVRPKERQVGELHWVVRDEVGKICHEVRFPPSVLLGNPYRAVIGLPLGRFTVCAETTTGLKGETAFTIARFDGEPPVVRYAIE